jgi:hypothetical protein
MSFWQFAQLHGGEFGTIGFGFLFLVSEWLGTNEKYKSNSIWQLINDWLKKKAEKPSA